MGLNCTPFVSRRNCWTASGVQFAFSLGPFLMPEKKSFAKGRGGFGRIVKKKFSAILKTGHTDVRFSRVQLKREKGASEP